jgi:hypothetical protein
MQTTQSNNTQNNAIITHLVDHLNKVHLPAKSIAIYKRDISQLEDDIFKLMNFNILFEDTANIETLIHGLKSYLKSKNISTATIIDDIAKNLYLYQEITHSKLFRMSLKTISSDMCTKFHSDFNRLRLLCTYAGRSTIWLQPLQNKKSKIAIDNYTTKEVGTGNIAILKGEKYPNSIPVLHRSPSIEKENKTRLLLKIDSI